MNNNNDISISKTQNTNKENTKKDSQTKEQKINTQATPQSTENKENTQTTENRGNKTTMNRKPIKKNMKGPRRNNKNNLSIEILTQKRVSTTREGGSKTSYFVMSACGNKAGSIGLGIGKASNFSGAMTKANNNAKKNMTPVLGGVKNRTTFHNTVIKKRGISMVITKAPAGQGLKAISTVEKMCNLIGVTDLSVKVHGPRNKINIAQLFYQALIEQIPLKKIAQFKEKNIAQLSAVRAN
ncbi:MAG: hypothetical protein AAFO15_01635 [Pseudomonadota bacterium]